jgi:hypothetical protein
MSLPACRSTQNGLAILGDPIKLDRGYKATDLVSEQYIYENIL